MPPVEVPVGIGLLEHAGLGGAGQIGVKDEQVVMLRAQLLQGVPVALTGRDLFHTAILHRLHFRQLSAELLHGDLIFLVVGALPCQPAWFSMKLTPLPW